MAIGADDGQIPKARAMVLGEFRERQTVMALGEAFSKRSVCGEKIKVANLASKLSDRGECPRLFLGYGSSISLFSPMKPQKFPPFRKFLLRGSFRD